MEETSLWPCLSSDTLVRNERVEIKKRTHNGELKWRLKLLLMELMTGKQRLFVTYLYISIYGLSHVLDGK
jgi:hypothetical protein